MIDKDAKKNIPKHFEKLQQNLKIENTPQVAGKEKKLKRKIEKT